MGLYLKIIYFPLYFIFFLEASPISALPHLSHGYPHIHFSLLLLPLKHQMPYSQIAITISEVMAMACKIPENVDFPFYFEFCSQSVTVPAGLSLKVISLPLSFIVLLKAYPVSYLPYIYHGYN